MGSSSTLAELDNDVLDIVCGLLSESDKVWMSSLSSVITNSKAHSELCIPDPFVDHRQTHKSHSDTTLVQTAQALLRWEPTLEARFSQTEDLESETRAIR